MNSIFPDGLLSVAHELHAATLQLRARLRKQGLDEIEACHLSNRFASGKFPDGRGRLLKAAPNIEPLLLDQIEGLRLKYDTLKKKC